MTAKKRRGPRKPDSWGMDEWFMCFPGPWIESYLPLDNYQFRVGVTLLMLIYETDKPLKAPDQYLAGKCRLGVKKFREVVDELIAAKKLVRGEDGSLSHPKCEEVLAIRRAYRASKSHPSSTSAEAEAEPSASPAPDQHEQNSGNDNENNGASQPQDERNSVKGKGKGKEDSSEDLRSSAAAPPDDAPPTLSGNALWLASARILHPDPGWDEAEHSPAFKRAKREGKAKVGVVNEAIKAELGGTAKDAERVLQRALLALMQNGSRGEDAVAYLRSAAMGIVRDIRTAEARDVPQGAGAAPEYDSEFDENGRLVFVNPKTGTRARLSDMAKPEAA